MPKKLSFHMFVQGGKCAQITIFAQYSKGDNVSHFLRLTNVVKIYVLLRSMHRKYGGFML